MLLRYLLKLQHFISADLCDINEQCYLYPGVMELFHLFLGILQVMDE